ncbi:hypothetical protein [Chelativorans sp. J32]|uniref:hypothetical protein n=1 Tax=Chelativorans sp. J32 TaxID=935840 RepID=UPI0004AF815D|nr:hypothetical protein [Chelativorans sp. J32]
MTRKRLFIIGNGRVPFDMSEQVDSSDHVVRFNEPKQSIGMTGTKTTWLFVANSGKPMQRRLEDPKYPTSPIVQATDLVFLAYHPQIVRKYFKKPNFLSWLGGRRADWTKAAMAMFAEAGKAVALLPPSNYEAGCAELGLTREMMRSVFPSTGYFGIRYALERLPAEEWDVEIAGFSWEGWRRHAWGDERAWVMRKVEERNIRVWLADDGGANSKERDREDGQKA